MKLVRFTGSTNSITVTNIDWTDVLEDNVAYRVKAYLVMDRIDTLYEESSLLVGCNLGQTSYEASGGDTDGLKVDNDYVVWTSSVQAVSGNTNYSNWINGYSPEFIINDLPPSSITINLFNIGGTLEGNIDNWNITFEFHKLGRNHF